MPVFLVLGISTFYRLGVTTFGYVLQSINKVNLLFKLAIVITAQYAVWVALGVMSRNLTIVAVAVVAAYFVQVMISYIGLDIGFGYRWYTTFFKMKGMFVFHFIMLLYAGTLHVMLSIQSTILSLLVKGMLVLFPFLVYILTTKKINLVKEALR